MKKTLLLAFLLALFCGNINAQEINEAANWPNTLWSLSGSFDTDHLDHNPTIPSGSTSFSFNDDDAGGSSINNVAVESPVIDLTTAFNANETELIVSFDYVLNIYQTESLQIQYWNTSNGTWENWGSELVILNDAGHIWARIALHLRFTAAPEVITVKTRAKKLHF